MRCPHLPPPPAHKTLKHLNSCTLALLMANTDVGPVVKDPTPFCRGDATGCRGKREWAILHRITLTLVSVSGHPFPFRTYMSKVTSPCASASLVQKHKVPWENLFSSHVHPICSGLSTPSSVRSPCKEGDESLSFTLHH